MLGMCYWTVLKFVFLSVAVHLSIDLCAWDVLFEELEHISGPIQGSEYFIKQKHRKSQFQELEYFFRTERTGSPNWRNQSIIFQY